MEKRKVRAECLWRKEFWWKVLLKKKKKAAWNKHRRYSSRDMNRGTVPNTCPDFISGHNLLGRAGCR